MKKYLYFLIINNLYNGMEDIYNGMENNNNCKSIYCSKQSSLKSNNNIEINDMEIISYSSKSPLKSNNSMEDKNISINNQKNSNNSLLNFNSNNISPKRLCHSVKLYKKKNNNLNNSINNSVNNISVKQLSHSVKLKKKRFRKFIR
jgi:hypothetical protein